MEKDLWDWQEYNEVLRVPPNAQRRFMLTLSKEKPPKDHLGFIIEGAFHYEESDNGDKLWVKFIEDKKD